VNNKDGKVKNINLGDIMYDKFYLADGEKYRKETKCIQNHITVYGNHEASMGYLMDGDFVNDYLLTHYFVDTTTAGKKMVNNRGFFVSYDDDFAVKYVVVSPYYMNEDGTRDGVEIRSDQMEWLLKELSANDGYDIVILMHQLWTDTYIHRDGTVQNWQDAPPVLENTWKVLKDRRNKRSGTITDSEGVSHSYDFTDCESILVDIYNASNEILKVKFYVHDTRYEDLHSLKPYNYSFELKQGANAIELPLDAGMFAYPPAEGIFANVGEIGFIFDRGELHEEMQVIYMDNLRAKMKA
jgi:hypothetical protein